MSIHDRFRASRPLILSAEQRFRCFLQLVEIDVQRLRSLSSCFIYIMEAVNEYMNSS